MIQRRLPIVLLLASVGLGFSDGAVSTKIREGNKLYADGKLAEALTHYNDAQLEAPAQPEIFFNMGNVLYRQRKFAESVDAYRRAMEKGDLALEDRKSVV